MQIKEVSNLTGLTIKTIRFYVERGLVEPHMEYRNGRNYKDFDEADIQRLSTVSTLRKCLFSIEQIKTMLDHPELTPDIFTEYRAALLSQRDLLTLLAEKAESMDPETLDGPDVLARRLTITAKPLPLPQADVSPHFGKFDPETPEERQAAYLKWQKEYKYRHLKWIIPLALTLFVLILATGIQTEAIRRDALDRFSRMEAILTESPITYSASLRNSLRSGYSDNGFTANIAYGLYDASGTLLPVEHPSRYVSSEDLTPAMALDDVLGDYFYPYSPENSEVLRSELDVWAKAQGQIETSASSSGILTQTIGAIHRVTIQEQEYTLALYYHGSPLLRSMRSLIWLYGVAVFIWFMVIIFRGTRGYGFHVRFIRNYGLRGTWNDAIISIDEKNKDATMLTHQYTGMGNLVNMDYKSDD